MVRGRLWRCSNPHLDEAVRADLVAALMAARRAVRDGGRLDDGGRDEAGRGGIADARRRVDAAKRGLGERGPVWWDDGAPDLNRRLARNTPYADWYESLPPEG